MALRIRKDVWKLRQDSQWDPVLEWYARAVAAMMARPIDDPTSWRYQAAIHDYEREWDPLAGSDDPLPTPADQKKFWARCQHNTWFFLPWHRMYLGFFEQIVGKTIIDLGGPQDWALPYWNYSDGGNPDARRLPPAFVASNTPAGDPNPLRTMSRAAGNAGEVVASARQVDIRNCLLEPSFQGRGIGGNPGFGGPVTAFSHSGGTPPGKLETTPHGSMHGAVGDWMGAFNTAALDPLFWLHHANIDRLWVVWRQRDVLHLDPTDSRWLSLPFDFHDAAGNLARLTPADVVDTRLAPFEYNYDDVADLLGGTPAAPSGVSRILTMVQGPVPEMVGASDKAVVLSGEPTSTTLTVTRPTGPAARTAGGPPEIYLNIENVTGEGKPTAYAVFLNIPQGETAEQHPELYAGLIPMFGVAEATRTDRDHSGGGLNYSLDISEVVQRLEARDDWNPGELRVTFVPEGPAGPRTARTAAPDPIQVGRVSLYFA